MSNIRSPLPNGVTFHPRQDIEDGLVKADALISIQGTADRPAEIPLGAFGQILRLRFDDVPFPTEWRSHRGEVYVGMDEGQFIEAINFARQFTGTIAVHCLHGRSRSAATALAILMDRCKDAEEAVTVLLNVDLERRVQPNPGIVEMIERILGGKGLDDVLTNRCEDYRTWKKYWSRHGWQAGGENDER